MLPPLGEGEAALVVGALLAGALLASLVAGRLRVPGLVLFLAVGMLVGSDGTGWIAFTTTSWRAPSASSRSR